MNIGDLLSKKWVQILIALFIGAVVLLYKFNILDVLLPKKTTIVAIDQNNSDVKIYEDTLDNKTYLVGDSIVSTDTLSDKAEN